MKISLITATYNSAGTLTDCFTSVASQDYINLEYIVIDGASKDNSINIINKHKSLISIFETKPDNGIYDALNKGIFYANGDIIGFLHSDDVFGSSETLSSLAALFNDPSVSAVYGDLEYISRGDPSKIIRKWKSNIFQIGSLKWGWMPPHPTLYVRREWYLRTGGFDPSYTISADYDSVLKLFSNKNFKSIYLPKVIVKMRLGGISNRSIFTVIKKTREDWHALKVSGFNLPERFRAILWKNVSKFIQFINLN